MASTPLHLKLKFRQTVWHDQPYVSPQTQQVIEMDFFDRAEPIHRAMPILQEPGVHTPIVIIGERRAGKTSLLKLLLHQLNENKDQCFIGIEIPWLGIDSASTLMKEFLESLFLAIDPEDSELQREIRQVSDQRDFEAMMKKIMSHKPGAIVVFGVDELDSILQDQVTNQAAQKEIIKLIYSFFDESNSLPIKLILTTTREPEKFDIDYQQLTAKTEIIRLAPFPISDFNNLIDSILEKEFGLTEQERDAIYALSGSWPYWIKALLYHLVQLPSGNQRMQQAKMQAIQSVSDTWEHIYKQHWNEHQHALILFIAQHGGQITANQISLHNNFTIALHDLIKRGYVIQTSDGYSFQIQLLQDWLSQWVRFDEQAQKYRSFLSSLVPERDPWVDDDEDVVEVSKEDLRRRGF